MKKKRTFTIDRKCSLYERTIIGIDGQPHLGETDKKGKDGHFTNEGPYRQAIERAVTEYQR